MANMKKNRSIFNLGILAHVDAGKTTLTEGMLFQAGYIRKMGNVDDGTTVTDSMDLEKKRGMTIKSSVVSFQWNNLKINLIDTPGHFDFLSEVESVLHVLDVVVLVIAAREGVQPQTRLFFRKLSELNIPTVIFINKLDRIGVDYDDLIKTIRTNLTDEILECQRYSGVGGKQVEIEDIPLEDEEMQMKLERLEIQQYGMVQTGADAQSPDKLNDVDYVGSLDTWEVGKPIERTETEVLQRLVELLFFIGVLPVGAEVCLAPCHHGLQDGDKALAEFGK